ncbi:hypothetical protein A2757_00215 [Candidatus Giovannonibacteria bacterium RIFCSPHIGHO2_01_FULL_48_47]|nr:MAG: hypothetical protein A2757_00215 [Candidatus Giovannonibacteria bacterium RIFCSPHIGHO2_01_FULL_48_47]OGF68915.1 MAG: hypothetical protein A3D61_03210 [Candidatus Giovannonibacteria bacterium RIFCSPHIGHO2_02_FULL_48_15]OGF88545.1 MAG: hypothetical protein A3B26_00140 [Candidatus Giovannonibacteria bacterium RIFCSPLOWO2_01_FULL_48_47]OGF95498.1 MAG: hypothetical protein A2433_01720 [Candidatus Giovannonibacteria bacterium RIFOXYC1_FULL_48_8]OGF96430.1 MAG: hypothetical protein A2613_02630
MNKTNKSFLKRLKVTPTGKVFARIPGQNHFNAKTRRLKQLHLKGWKNFSIDRQTLKHYLPYI